ncbi:MAG: TIGR02281 family clan AA aspartic protease [Rhodobacteraceae bacterium]|jgi:aspartyl protease family protein|nr:TIGR02281 family clan AA aspartic protease [Paracoccaceae bacterium]
MAGEDWGRLAYLGLLLVAVGGWLFTNRQGLSKNLQQASVWAFLFIGVIAGYGLWGDVRGQLLPGQAMVTGSGRIEVPRSFDGHYHLTVEINGAPVDVMVDTGATDLVLTMQDAKAAGIDIGSLRFSEQAMTANGLVATAPVRIASVRLGDIEQRDVRASINGGEMSGSLLGMSYLERFGRIEISGGRLVLER